MPRARRWGQAMHGIGRGTAICFGLAVWLGLSAGVANAQGLFETLFGARPARAALPPGYADPTRDPGDPFFQRRPRSAPTATIEASSGGSGASGGTTAYCVRLCDGRYFPLQRHVAASPVELCNAFCPAARTKVFYGGEIDGARAHDGSRYAGLEHAFLYRKQIVADCTCNGETHYGLAKIDPAKDPTLRPGDLVANGKGLMAFRGTHGRGASETAAFTPVDRSRRDAGNIAVAGRN
jgi:uncharacterized protein DUF2865